ncbi:S-layer homology domain-containing protein [Desulfoscipio gibsoniae]
MRLNAMNQFNAILHGKQFFLIPSGDILGNISLVVTAGEGDTSQAYTFEISQKNGALFFKSMEILGGTLNGIFTEDSSFVTAKADNDNYGITVNMKSPISPGPGKFAVYTLDGTSPLFEAERPKGINKTNTYTVSGLETGITYRLVLSVTISEKVYYQTTLLYATAAHQKYSVQLLPDQEGAVVTVFDSEGDQQVPEETGVYSLTSGNYSYVVAKEGYFTAAGTFGVVDSNLEIPVALTAAPSGEHSAELLSIGGTLTDISGNITQFSAAEYSKDNFIYISETIKSRPETDFRFKGVLQSPYATVTINSTCLQDTQDYAVNYDIENGKRVFSTAAFNSYGENALSYHITIKDGELSKTYLFILDNSYGSQGTRDIWLLNGETEEILDEAYQPVIGSGHTVASVSLPEGVNTLRVQHNIESNKITTDYRQSLFKDLNYVRVNGGAYNRFDASRQGERAYSTELPLKQGVNVVEVELVSYSVSKITAAPESGFENVPDSKKVLNHYVFLIECSEADGSVDTVTDTGLRGIQVYQFMKTQSSAMGAEDDCKQYPVNNQNGTYTVGIPNDMLYELLLLRAAPGDNACSVAVGGSIGWQVGSYYVVPVDAGQTEQIEVTVTAPSGDRQKHIIQIKWASSNVRLDSVNIEGGTLNKVFDKDIFNYIVTPGADIEALSVTPVLEDSKASLTINGSLAVSGETALIPVSEPKLLIEVTAEDGFSKQVYVFLIGTDNPGISQETRARAQEMLDKAMEYGEKEMGKDLSDGYWGTFDWAAAGKSLDGYAVYDVTQHKDGDFSQYQATDYAAIILQLVMLGENPYNYEGINYVEKLQAVDTTSAGVFGPFANNIWALLALDAAGADYNPNLIEIVKQQAASDSFDMDMRGWALAAIQNHRDEPNMLEDIAGITEAFKKRQADNGELYGDYGFNCNTLCCVLTGLGAAGIDVGGEDWKRNGKDPLDALAAYQKEDGAFYYKDNQYPGFNKDVPIALGALINGYNVWQHQCLTWEKFSGLTERAGNMLENDLDGHGSAKDDLKAVYNAALEVSEDTIKGQGELYYNLYEAMSVIDPSMKADVTIGKPSEDPGEDPVEEKNNITVYFALLGTDADGEDGKVNTLSEGNLTTWISKTSVEVEEGSRVYDVFSKVLDDNGYKYAGADNNYVRSIRTPGGLTLAEYTNGPNSGWMYTVNGTHPMLGLKDYVLQNGDVIVWHYTDDYTLEEDSMGWDDNASSLINKIDEKSESIVLQTEVKDGEAIALVKSEDIDKLLENVKENGGTNIRIKVETEETVNKVIVELPMDSVFDMASSALSMTIETPNGNVSLDSEALKTIVGKGGGDVNFSIEQLDSDSLSEENRELVGDHPVYALAIAANGRDVTDFGGGSVQVSLPYTPADDEDADKLTVYYLDDEGNAVRMTGAYYDEETGCMIFTTDHFSTFAVVYEALLNFTDVTENAWYYDAVLYVDKNGLFSGTSNTTFSPDVDMTRTMLVTVLYRLEGEPTVTAENSFTDVEGGAWYANAVIWAVENGIVSGYGDGIFGTNDNTTREQMAAILYNYAKYKGYDITATTELAAYSDSGNISKWAETAMCWAVDKELISGTTATTLAPDGSATRAQVAAILMRFHENIVE